MLNKIRTLLVNYIAVFFILGCSGEGGKDGVTPQAKYYIHADTDGGAPFRFETNDDDKNFTFGSGNFTMYALTGDYKGLTIWGAEPFRGQPVEMAILAAEYQTSRFEKFTSGTGKNAKKSPNGKITITKATDFMAEGTFAFDAYADDEKSGETVRVRNGKFRIRY